MMCRITGSQAGQSGKEKNIFAAPHPTLSMRKKKNMGQLPQNATFLTCLLSLFHSSDFPVWSLPDFQLQQVNKRQKILLIIAGTFRRYSEISMLNHSAQRENTQCARPRLAVIQKAGRVVSLQSTLLNRLCLAMLAKQAGNK